MTSNTENIAVLVTKAIEVFNSLNAQDPNKETVDGEVYPRELLYAKRLSAWVLKLKTKPSVPLQLAAYCQHLMRWKIKRSNFSNDRKGYLQWRSQLAQFHANETREVLISLGFDKSIVDVTQHIVLKKNRNQQDSDSQIMEDALCLVFLEFQLEDFLEKNNYLEEKVISIIRKTWNKMSEKGRKEALKLAYRPETLSLISKAINAH